MGENKGHGTKGRNYDELSGVGTSSAGVTGTTGNLNDGVRDGGVGKPSARDSGNRAGNMQSAEPDDDDVTPALGTGSRGAAGNQQGGQAQSQQAQQSQQSGGQQGQSQQSGSQSASRQGQSQQSGSQQSGSQQSGSQQSGSRQSGGQDQPLGERSLDQDVMGKEQ